MSLTTEESKLLLEIANKVDNLVTDAVKQKDETLNELLSELKLEIAGLTESDIVSIAKDKIDTYIKTNYGELPPVYHVEFNGVINKITGIRHMTTDRVLRKLVANVPVFMYGPAGAGKNAIAEQCAKALNLDFYYMNAVKQEFNLTGFVDARGRFIETPFYHACLNGGLMMIDEIDSSIPEVLVKLNSALSNGYFDFPIGEDKDGNLVGGRVPVHYKTRFIVAGNTTGQGADRLYTGRNQLDAATLDRFSMVHINYDENMERRIAGEHTDLLEFIHALREAILSMEMRYVLSIRALKHAILLIKQNEPILELVEDTIVKGIHYDDLKQIYGKMKNLPGNKYYKTLAALVK